MEIPDGKKRWARAFLAAAAAACFVVLSELSFASDRASLSGRVTDAAGKPIEHATVMVYHAGVKKGYSTFCPSCYVDCGKRVFTDARGMFRFEGLNPDLWFELLVARDGYEPTFVKKVDPASGDPAAATLVRRQSVSDPDRLFRGRVEDSQGHALRDAVVQPVGLLDPKTGASTYFWLPGMDPVAISNKDGEFEIAYSKQGAKILISVEARGMAPAFAVIPSGFDRHAITVMEGATVHGRLVRDGNPVGGAEVGLIGRPRGGYGQNLELSGYPYDEIRIGTQPDGTFATTNVPVPVDWYIYGKMESLATRGATGTVECATKHDKEVVDVGDLAIKPALHLRGRVVLSDGKPIPDGMRVTIGSKLAWDSQTAVLPPDGRFEFIGLAPGGYSVFASVRGYEGGPPPLSIDQDVEDLLITLHPENRVTSPGTNSGPSQPRPY